MPETRDISLTFLKGMSVLKAFDETRTHMTLADIARQSGLDPASARRLVLTLVHLGYVRKEGRQFSLTPRVLVLAAGFLRGHQFGKLVQPVLNANAAEIGLGVSLAMMDDDQALLVAQSTLSDSMITFGFTLGSRLPILQTSIGRMLLAYGDPALARDLVERVPVEPFTPETVTDRARIADEIATAAEQGYCVTRGEFEAGTTGIAVPIGARGTVKAVLGVSDVTRRFPDDQAVTDVVNALRRYALELTRTQIF